jgi:hypothetical protein
MPISDDDLNYLRNINTRPGRNAGRSIDPTKPGPDDALAQSEAGPATRYRALLREARPYVASAKGDDTETHNFVDGLLRDIDAALAQSDAEPIPDCPTDGVAARQGNGG